jgi:O-acetyl-ADP-ribose deacetylase (regulator of RNase III)
MPFLIVRQDILEVKTDAIVNSTSSRFKYIGGTEQKIMTKGGNDLLKAREELGFIEVTDAFVTKGYDLIQDFVIHCVGPYYKSDKSSYGLLRETYLKALNLAFDHGLESIAFPLISTGVYGFPKKIALEIAENAIKEFLLSKDMMVYLLVYDLESYITSIELFNDVRDYIEQHFVDGIFVEKMIMSDTQIEIKRISNRLFDIDETFSDTLIKLIVLTGEKNSIIYKRANLDKRLFSKIISNSDYHPSKNVAIALGIALKLNIDEFNDFLERAGYILSNSILSDVIIQFCIENELYDIYEINEILYDHDQALLGSTMN